MHSVEAEARISVRVREAREFLGLSIEELAEMLGIDPEELEAIEGARQPVTAGFLPALAKTLGRSLDYFTSEIPAQTASERTEFLARAAETLSEQDIAELERFASYLRSRPRGAAA